MLARNISRLEKIEFQQGPLELLQGQGIKIDGKWQVEGWGNSEITGTYTDEEYKALAARPGVMIVSLLVRAPIA